MSSKRSICSNPLQQTLRNSLRHSLREDQRITHLVNRQGNPLESRQHSLPNSLSIAPLRNHRKALRINRRANQADSHQVREWLPCFN